MHGSSALLILTHNLVLLPVVEQYTKNVRFCIICNYVNKIIPAIQSRCTRFRFSPLSTEQIESRLDLVIEQEQCVAHSTFLLCHQDARLTDSLAH